MYCGRCNDLSANSLVTSGNAEPMGDGSKTQLLINREIWTTILEKINSAESEICIAFPWITYDPLVETLLKVKKQRPRIKIKVITSINHDDPEHTENIKKLDEYGIQIQTIFQPFVHCKSVCVDRKVLITGSANATFSAANLNKEHGMLTEEELPIEKFQKDFKKDWSAALSWGAKITREDTARTI